MIDDPAADFIVEKLKKFRNSAVRGLGTLNNVCEREVEKDNDVACEI